MEKIRYFILAVLYKQWEIEIKRCNLMNKYVSLIIQKLLHLLMPGYQTKHNVNQNNQPILINKSTDIINNGMYINYAIKTIETCLFLFSWSILFPIAFTSSILFLGEINILWGSIFVLIGCYIIYRLFYKYIIDNKQYKSHFKIFMRENAKWQKKWLIINIVFVTLSIISGILSGFLTFYILAFIGEC